MGGVGSCPTQLRLITGKGEQGITLRYGFEGENNEGTWLNLLGHDLIGLILVGLMSEIWEQGAELKRFGQRWARFVARRRRQQARVVSQGLPGLGHHPDCAEYQGKITAVVEPASPPPWVEPKRGRRREIKPTWQFCPDEDCRYYGWPGLGNLTSNGHPNSSSWR